MRKTHREGRWQEDVLRIPQGIVIFHSNSSRSLMTSRVLWGKVCMFGKYSVPCLLKM